MNKIIVIDNQKILNWNNFSVIIKRDSKGVSKICLEPALSTDNYYYEKNINFISENARDSAFEYLKFVLSDPNLHIAIIDTKSSNFFPND